MPTPTPTANCSKCQMPLLQRKLYAPTAFWALALGRLNARMPAARLMPNQGGIQGRRKVSKVFGLLLLSGFLGWRNSWPHGIGCATGRCASGLEFRPFFLRALGFLPLALSKLSTGSTLTFIVWLLSSRQATSASSTFTPPLTESRERIRSALKNSGYDIPPTNTTINLAPGAKHRVTLEHFLQMVRFIFCSSDLNRGWLRKLRKRNEPLIP